jgi:hypothetical protein
MDFRLEETTGWGAGSGNHVVFGLSKGQLSGSGYNMTILKYHQNAQDSHIGGNYSGCTVFGTDVSSSSGNVSTLTVQRTGSTFKVWIGSTLIGLISNATTSDLRLTVNPVVWNASAGAVQSFSVGIDDIKGYK